MNLSTMGPSLKNLTQALEKLTTNTGKTLQGFKISLDSMANVMNNMLVLDYLLAEPGRVYKVINETCYA